MNAEPMSERRELAGIRMRVHEEFRRAADALAPVYAALKWEWGKHWPEHARDERYIPGAVDIYAALSRLLESAHEAYRESEAAWGSCSSGGLCVEVLNDEEPPYVTVRIGFQFDEVTFKRPALTASPGADDGAGEAPT